MDIFSWDELYKEIQEDKNAKGSYSRYPVRYLFVPNLSVLEKIVGKMVAWNINLLELSEHLSHEDAWLDNEMITKKITNLNISKDYLILGVSELARFYKEDTFFSMIMTLSEIENMPSNKGRRIYIPFIGLDNNMKENFCNRFHRKEELNIIWKLNLNESEPLRVYVASFKLSEENEKCIINNTKQWLELWKNSNIEDIDYVITCSETLTYQYKKLIPDNAFIIEKINNFKEYLEKVRKINVTIDYKEEEKNFWMDLNNNINKNNLEFLRVIKLIFNIANITRLDVIREWFTNEDRYKRWLLKSYILYLEQFNDNSLYICKVMKKINDFDDIELIKLLWFEIFGIEVKSCKWFSERLNLIKESLKHINITPDRLDLIIGSQLEEEINNVDNSKEKYKYITGITGYEKQIVIKMYKNKEIEYEAIKKIYPDLYYYLEKPYFNNLEDEKDFVDDYFKEYKFSKINNEVSNLLVYMLNNNNKDSASFYSWYHRFEHIENILNEFKIDKIICIDALGVEWTSLVNNILKELGYSPPINYIAKSHLPSTTEYNKIDSVKSEDWIYDFDKLIHMKVYEYPKSFVEEIQKIRYILENHININGEKSFAIIADHGLSVFPRLYEKKHNFEDSEHNGRFMKTDGKNIDTEDYCRYVGINNQDFIVCLNYNSLYKKPTREVHGGATPEEVLVPIIIVQDGTKILGDTVKLKQDIIYNIEFDTLEVDRLDPSLYFKVKPDSNDRFIITDNNNKEYIPEYDKNQDKWIIRLDNVHIRNIKIRLENYEETFEIKLKTGMEEDDLF